VSALPWPDHLLTLDEWEALPDEQRFHIEVVDGVLIVAPKPFPFHQFAMMRLGNLLDKQISADFTALLEVEVVIAENPLTVRIPDVIVLPTKIFETNPARFHATDVRLAIEVLSKGTLRTDRVTKFAEYAEVGIEHYWLVDLDSPTSLTTFRLIEGEYENFGEHTGTVTLDFNGTPITLNLDELTTRRAQKL
jgi:Uma2 family endonuclease